MSGAIVQITETVSKPYKKDLFEVVDLIYVSRCGGCRAERVREFDFLKSHKGDYFEKAGAMYDAPQGWAQAHAEKCRALPRPEGS
ncbi:hypothetical protein [Streptomyces ehimensis]|uniref:Uncharacterized protein n=1 Tax=Streptomyces ehimensis TaxID=68195 RepID=A0ABV9BEZ6_9ACTN